MSAVTNGLMSLIRSSAAGQEIPRQRRDWRFLVAQLFRTTILVNTNRFHAGHGRTPAARGYLAPLSSFSKPKTRPLGSVQ